MTPSAAGLPDSAPIRIGINATSLLSPLTGVGQYTYRLCSELLAMQEFNLTFFYGAGWSSTLRDRPATGIVQAKNLAKQLLPRPYLLKRAVEQLRFGSGARRLALQVYHDPNFLPLAFAGPRVITIHDLSCFQHPQSHPRERVEVMQRRLPEAIAGVEAILTVSEFTRQQVIGHFGVAPGKVIATPLAAGPEFFPRDHADLAQALGSLGLAAGNYCLSVGTLEPRKNLLSALHAFSMLPRPLRARFPLVIVGMKGWDTQPIEQAMADMLAAGEVRVLGYQPSALLPLLYAGARFLVYPSLYEGFGLPPLEALASGTPVIASNCSSIPEVVGDAAILTEPRDVEAMRDAMRSLLEDDTRHAELRQRGLKRAQGFSWQRCATATAEVYRKLARLQPDN